MRAATLEGSAVTGRWSLRCCVTDFFTPRWFHLLDLNPVLMALISFVSDNRCLCLYSATHILPGLQQAPNKCLPGKLVSPLPGVGLSVVNYYVWYAKFPEVIFGGIALGSLHHGVITPQTKIKIKHSWHFLGNLAMRSAQWFLNQSTNRYGVTFMCKCLHLKNSYPSYKETWRKRTSIPQINITVLWL